MTHHWLVVGVGRSGTTAVYEALQDLAPRRRSFNYFYEPYLWGPPTWGARFRASAKAFTTTDSISADGLRRHLATPLFDSEARERCADHKTFVERLFKSGAPTLAKVIRGCGRLKDYLELRPELKIVFVIRNPLDCVNSAMGNFSFFGDEFHPSDQPRFRSELAFLGRPQPDFTTEGEAATAWWREMNAAALRAIEPHRERVFIAPHEAYIRDHALTLRLLAKFLAVKVKAKKATSLDRPVGQITRAVNLHAHDRDCIDPFQVDYFDLIERISDIPIKKSWRSIAKTIDVKYKNLRPGAFVPDTPRDASPLRVRAVLAQERQVRRVAAADMRGALESLRRSENALSDGPARAEGTRRDRRGP